MLERVSQYISIDVHRSGSLKVDGLCVALTRRKFALQGSLIPLEASTLPPHMHHAHAQALLNDSDPVVRDAAEWAVGRLS